MIYECTITLQGAIHAAIHAYSGYSYKYIGHRALVATHVVSFVPVGQEARALYAKNKELTCP
jgi:uncharacterized membrane protein (DUF4010 family)